MHFQQSSIGHWVVLLIMVVASSAKPEMDEEEKVENLPFEDKLRDPL